jgi:hypothetical protein
MALKKNAMTLVRYQAVVV